MRAEEAKVEDALLHLLYAPDLRHAPYQNALYAGS
jgi:hypothetical protein